ncbi:hypothetical protein [Tessaracoccus flavescens]|uniref:hypothetical protein n=1 Tax=Tessaracoccus flavescens TaxID=399497 RepID=UPI001F3ED0D1|nr:hypothetical protein [Tessaracoccus flavescens]
MRQLDPRDGHAGGDQRDRDAPGADCELDGAPTVGELGERGDSRAEHVIGEHPLAR